MPFCYYYPMATDLKKTIHKNPPKNGKYYLVAIDGRGGAGKTTLTEYVTKILPNFTVINGDDYFEPDENTIAFGSFNDERFHNDVVSHLQKHERSIAYRPYDWHKTPHITERQLTIGDGLIIERNLIFAVDLDWDIKIWVEAPADLALQRGQERDEMPLEQGYRSWKEVWQPAEDAHIKKFRPLETSDIVIDGTKDFKLQIS